MINNRILIKICGHESEKVTGSWRKQRDENFDESHRLSNDTIKMNYRWCGVRKNVSCGEKLRSSERLQWKNVQETSQFRKLSLDGKIGFIWRKEVASGELL